MLKYPFLQDEVFEFLSTNDLDITDLIKKTTKKLVLFKDQTF